MTDFHAKETRPLETTRPPMSQTQQITLSAKSLAALLFSVAAVAGTGTHFAASAPAPRADNSALAQMQQTLDELRKGQAVANERLAALEAKVALLQPQPRR
jgi:hypothetical protein